MRLSRRVLGPAIVLSLIGVSTSSYAEEPKPMSLLEAARQGDVAVVKRLLGQGADPNATDFQGEMTPSPAVALMPRRFASCFRLARTFERAICKFEDQGANNRVRPR